MIAVSGEGSIAATAALLVACMSLWATALLPEIVTALAFFGLAMLLRLGSAATVFSGLSSSAFWLVLSGLVVGQGMTRTGLGARMARSLALRLSGSYGHFITGLVALSFLIEICPARIHGGTHINIALAGPASASNMAMFRFACILSSTGSS